MEKLYYLLLKQQVSDFVILTSTLFSAIIFRFSKKKKKYRNDYY